MGRREAEAHGRTVPPVGAGLVLWDFDGTLASTSQDVWGSLRFAAEKRALRFPQGFEDDDNNLALTVAELYGLLVPEPDPAGLPGFEQDVRVHYRSISTHPRTELYPGIQDLLGELRRRGTASRIVTNKPQGALERILRFKGWADLFDGWVCSDSEEDVELTKAQMASRAMAAQGAAPEDCVMVGDSWGDVAGARAVGVASVAVTYGDGSTERLLAEEPDYVAHDAAGLRKILLGGC